MILLLTLYHVLRVALLYAGQRWPALGDRCVHVWLRSCCWFLLLGKDGALLALGHNPCYLNSEKLGV
ncbi:hypothetical protein P8452_56840 [Trifolium repens]|nr:hypothetical protein P8452_56840 [Trifolium repens]